MRCGMSEEKREIQSSQTEKWKTKPTKTPEPSRIPPIWITPKRIAPRITPSVSVSSILAHVRIVITCRNEQIKPILIIAVQYAFMHASIAACNLHHVMMILFAHLFPLFSRLLSNRFHIIIPFLKSCYAENRRWCMSTN